MVGIYSIINTKNNKRYIGQSKNINKRFLQHKRELNKNQHINSHLQSAWNKYGEDVFIFALIEECEEDNLDTKEKEWIAFYKSDISKNGYNLNKGGQGITGFKHTDSQIEKMRVIQNPLVVLQFDKNRQFIKRYSGGASHVYKECGYTRSSIISRCQHKSKNLLYKDSYWIYENEYLSDTFSWEDFFNNISKFNFAKPNISKRNNKKIYQYDLNKNLVKIWNNFSEIEQAGFIKHQVNAICNRKSNKRTHKGYIWTYEDADITDSYYDIINITALSNKKRRSKPVCQWDKKKTKIKEYASITEAADALNTDTSDICRAIKARKVSMGYFWEYKNLPWIKECTIDLEEIYNKSNSAKKKEVIQYDQNYTIISVYPSITEAANAVGSSAGNISRAISNSNHLCKGYHWGLK